MLSSNFFLNTIFVIISSVLLIVPVIISVAFFTLSERKIMASIQRRKGPNVVGYWGLLQPLADGLKLIVKEIIIPSRVSSQIFLFAPFLTFVLSLAGWVVIPFSFSETISNINIGVLYIFTISSLGVYGVILAGWSSNSKYALLGALRSAAQMISYEISLGLTVLPVILISGSLNFTSIVYAQRDMWFFLPLLPLAVIFFISMLAETNRAPFDLPEAEAELVAGFNVEYSSITFALFFLGEYSSMILMSALIVIFFFGGWLLPFNLGNSFLAIQTNLEDLFFSFKICIFCFLYIFVRANFPRYRYDQLMNIGWKIFLPITLGYLVLSISILLTFNGLPL